MNLFNRNKAELKYILYEATVKCNLSCAFCYNHWKRDGSSDALKDNGYLASLKTLKRLFNLADVKHVTFTGGEPMLAERLGELILFCRMKGATVSLITNGNAGKTEDFVQLIKLGVQLFELPVHSADPSIHDRMTCVRGSWEKSVNTIRTITSQGGYVVPVIVITKYNYRLIGETIEFIHSLGFSRIMLNRYNIGGKEAYSPEKIAASKEELNEAFFQANVIAGKLKLIISSNVCTPHCVVNPQQYKNIRFTNCSPDISHRPLTLTAQGDLRFCNHSPTVLGNIFNNPIETILKNGSLLGDVASQPGFCTGCSLYSKCLGGCRAAAEQTGNTFGNVDPIVFYKPENQSSKTA